MPGPEKRPGGTGSSDPIAQFVNGLSAATGLNPGVVAAWVKVEGAFTSGGTGHYNYLNLRPASGGTSYSGVSLYGVSSGNFQQFNSVQDAVTETAYWINKFGNYAGIRSSTSQSPRTQIAAIAASPWDAGHYNGGSSLLAAYQDYITHPAGSFWAGVSKVGSAIGGAIVDAGSGNPIGAGTDVAKAIGLGGPVTDALQAPVAIANSIVDLTKWILDPQDWLRAGYVLGGGVMVIIGTVLLARSVGVPMPGPGAAPNQGGLPSGDDMQAEFDKGVGEGQRQAARREGRKEGRSHVSSSGTPKPKMKSTPGPAARPARARSASRVAAEDAVPF